MEANFFRFLAAELAPRLTGRRIQKVFCPADNTWTLELDRKEFLLFRPAKSVGLLFVTARKPRNPPRPPARAMYYRKRLAGRRIVGVSIDWPGLRLALELSPRKDQAPGDAGRFLILDVRHDLSLAESLDQSFDREPVWPDLEQVLSDPNVWRNHPQISPPLRRRLAALDSTDPGAANSLYENLVQGQAEAFRMGLEDEIPSPPLAWAQSSEGLRFDSAAEAARTFGERILFPLLEAQAESGQAAALARAKKKVRKNLAKLEREEERLRTMRQGKVEAEALQAELYKLDPEADLDRAVVTHPELGPLDVDLDPALTPAENMARRFKLAAKADRGLEHVQRRRGELARELERIESGQLPARPATSTGQATPSGASKTRAHVVPKRFRELAVHLFVTSDGFLVARGKNQKANHALTTKAAAPFDLWLHVADGPSSHVVLKRDFPDQEVPRQSLLEAAGLCALKSFRKDDSKADVMVAEARHVHAVKGAPPGRVSVAETIETLRVDVDPRLEHQLMLA